MKSTGYALHGVVYLARRAEQQPILLREIAEALQMPENYMAKIFQSLSKAGLVTASRGAHRGYRLARPAGEISLLDVVELFEGPIEEAGCFLEERTCVVVDGCMFGEFWGIVKKEVRRRLRRVTIQQFLEEGNREKHEPGSSASGSAEGLAQENKILDRINWITGWKITG